MENKVENERKKKVSVWTIVAVIAISAGLIGGLFYYYRSQSAVFSNDAQVQQLLSPVNARVGGYLAEVRFKEFQYVQAGDTLAIIDPSDLLIQRDLALAGLEDAKAGKSVASSSVNTVANAQSISEANIEETRIRLWNAQENYKRYQDLLASASVTQQQFDQIKTEYESLQARYNALLSTNKGSALSTTEAKTRLSVNDAAIKRATAALKQAEKNLSYAVITAPCAGIVGRKTVAEGQLIQAGQTLVNIVDDAEKWITVNFKEKEMRHISFGKEVRITVDAVPNETLTGKVVSIAGATGAVFSLVPTDNSTGNFVKVQQRIPVRVALSDSNPPEVVAKLRAGMNAEVFVEKD